MKTLKIILILAILIITVIANAESDYSLSTKFYKTVASDTESIVQSGAGLQLSLHRKWLYLYLSDDIHQVRFAGQSGPDINLWSAGIGMQHKVGKYLTLSLDAGWYEPKFSEMGERQAYYSSPFAEGLCRYLNQFLMPDTGDQPFVSNWNYYTLDYQGAVGGKLSINFTYPITDNISFNMTGGYRYLKLLENIKGQDYDGGFERLGEAGYWTVRHDRDFSGWMIGGMVVIGF